MAMALLGAWATLSGECLAQTTGNDLKVAIHARGFFKDVGGGAWTESGADGKVAFRFRETRRTAEAVFLLDTSRKVALELNTKDKKVYLVESSTSRRPHVDIMVARPAKWGDYFQIKSAGQCLQAVYLERDLAFSPELMPCDDSPGQHWNIEPGRVINGVATYRWRNLLTQMRGLDLCLSGAFANAVATMAPCDTGEGQRWLHAPPATASLKGLRTAAVQATVCLGYKHFTDLRYRDEGGSIKKDTDFWQAQMVYCGTRDGASVTNDPAWSLAPR
jgi:hypothetical protein